MPNRAIEIHESVLAAVSFSQGGLQFHFSSVYIHESEGVPGRDAGSGWVQKAVLRIHDAKVEGAFLEFPVDLNDGQTRMGEIVLDNEIPVPLRHNGVDPARGDCYWHANLRESVYQPRSAQVRSNQKRRSG